MVAVRERGALTSLPARNAAPGRVWHPVPAGWQPHQQRRSTIAGMVLLVQEGRLRLLDEQGRGSVFLLSPSASLEAQDLATLPGRRVRLRYHAAPKLMAGVVTAIELLA